MCVLGGICSTSSVSIVFNPSAGMVAHLVSGTTSDRSPIYNVTVMAGKANVIPTTFSGWGTGYSTYDRFGRVHLRLALVAVDVCSGGD